MIAPQINEIITELRLTSEMTDIIESSLCSDVRYAKSAMQMKMDISGIAHLQCNGVVF